MFNNYAALSMSLEPLLAAGENYGQVKSKTQKLNPVLLGVSESLILIGNATNLFCCWITPDFSPLMIIMV